MYLNKVSDNELIFDLKNLVQEERELLTTILRYLKEVEIRKIYLQMGYSSMFAYLTEELCYSESAAQRRIQAMRLLKDLPEIEAKIETGEISLSVAAAVQSYFKKEEKKSPLKKDEKLELINDLSGTSARECERHLIKLSPETALPSEKTRPLTCDSTLIQFVAGKDLMKKIERLKELTSHQNPEGKYEELFSRALDLALNKLDPIQRAARRAKKTKKSSRPSKSLIHISGNRPVRSQWPTTVGKALPQNKLPTPRTTKLPPTSAVEPKNRHIPNATRDKVWLRDQGKCQFKNLHTGKVCGSKRYLELDHKYPFALGGEHSESNLRLICRGHNQYRAEKMATFI